MSRLQHQDIIDKFSILYEIASHNGYPYFKPAMQKPLRGHMEKLVQLHPEWTDSHYVQSFLRIINEESELEPERQLAHLHLVAYIDLTRCHVVRKFSQKLSFSEEVLFNVFDLTAELLYNFDELKRCLNRYDEKDTRGANIKTYFQGIFKNTILKSLHLESRWHLLCNVDITSRRKFNNEQQKLREALERLGIIEPNITRYIFAWRYFVPVYKNNRLYNPNRRDTSKWPEPELSDFEETAKDYNVNRFDKTAPLPVSSSPEATPETIRRWLNICINALQQHSRIVEIPCDADSYDKQYYQFDNPWEFLELEFDQQQATSINQIDLAFKTEIQRIENNIEKLRSKIPVEVRKAVMPLCYPHELSPLVQEQLATKVGVNQGTIARYISTTYKAQLLDKIDEVIKINLAADPQAWVQKYVIDFLEKRFSNSNQSNLIEKTLVDTIEALDNPAQIILKLYYGQQMTVEEIINYFTNQKNKKIRFDEVIQELSLAQKQLQDTILSEINNFKIDYVSFWLKRYYKQVIQDQLLGSFNDLESCRQNVMKLRYCQNLSEQDINRLKPNVNVRQEINQSKQQLQESLLRWIYNTFGLSLEPEKEQISEVIEAWLKTLYAVEL